MTGFSNGRANSFRCGWEQVEVAYNWQQVESVLLKTLVPR